MANGQNLQGPDLSAMLSQLMSNPSAMSALTSILGSMSGSQNTQSEQSPPPPPTIERPPALPALSVSAAERERRALLCALKPYLSRERADLVDRLLGLMSVYELAAPLLGGYLGSANQRK